MQLQLSLCPANRYEMSPDKVVGVAVIDETTRPPTLYCICESWSNGQTGTKRIATIPILALGLPSVNGREWRFEQYPGARLKVTPSLRMLGWKEGDPDLFHNEGEWWVDYAIHDGKNKDLYDNAGDQLRALNGWERYRDQ